MLTANFYSTKPVPRDFQLSGNPYESPDARKELHDMGVFFYRDENNAKAVVLKWHVTGVVHYSMVLLDDSDPEGSMKVDEWAPQDVPGSTDFAAEVGEVSNQEDAEDLKELGIDPQGSLTPADRPDNLAWVEFNRPVTVVAYSTQELKLRD